MKKLLFLLLLAGAQAGSAQTAVDFTANDCSGNSHHLFSQLDAGKVVVICWVMPCSSCISPALSAQTSVQTFNGSYPGKVIFYIADDYANTSCATLNSWCNTNGLTASNARFSSGLIKMSDYGSDGMPKTVILAGANHQVFYNENNGLNSGAFNTAMSAAIAAANAVGLKETEKAGGQIRLFTDTSGETLGVQCTLSKEQAYAISLFNELGQKVKSVADFTAMGGEINVNIDVSDLERGMYFVSVNQSAAQKFLIQR